MRKSILSLALIATIGAAFGLQLAAFAASPLTATVSNSGLCWWHCAQAILNERGDYRPLIAQVRASGRTEASLSSVERFLSVEIVPTFQEAIPLVHGGTHVIATLRYPAGRHAVVIVDADERNVTYWNPNAPTQYATAPTTEIRQRWIVGTIIN